jgi:hypothetical protein
VFALGACTHHGGGPPPSLTPVGASLASQASSAAGLNPNKVTFDAPAARSVELAIVDAVPIGHLELDGVDQLLISAVTSSAGPDGAALPPGAITARGHIVLDGSFTLAGTIIVTPTTTHLSGAMIVAQPGALQLRAGDIAINATSTGLTTVTAQAQGEISAHGDDVVTAQAIPIPSTKLQSISWGGGGTLHAGAVPFTTDHLGVIGTVTGSVVPGDGVLAVVRSGAASPRGSRCSRPRRPSTRSAPRSTSPPVIRTRAAT